MQWIQRTQFPRSTLPRATLPRSTALLSCLVVASLAGCEGAAPPATLDDTAPERTLLGSEIADEFTFEDGFLVSDPLPAPAGATRVGFFLDVLPGAAAVDIALEARGLDADGRPTAWRPALFTWVEHPMRVGRVDLGVTAFAVEVRVPVDAIDALAHVTFNAVVPAEQGNDPGFDALASRPVGVAQVAPTVQGLSLTTPQARSAWGARATQCTSLNQTKTRITVHHTVTPTSAGDYTSRLRGIQAFHMDTRGWCDVGYHFLVTSDGTTWEGRAAQYLGTHVGGNNTNNLGVSFVGCFHSNSCSDFPPNTPPEVMIQGGGELIGEAAGHYGIAVSSSTIIGHRDNPGQTTSCPGDHLHDRLGDLRSIASGQPVSTDPTEPDGQDPVPPEPTLGRVQGVVWDLAVTTDVQEADALGASLPGATIECDCGLSTDARAGDAFWSLDLMPGVYTLTAVRDGYASTSRQVQVTSGGSHWASIGVAPTAEVVQLSLFVFDVQTAAGLANAFVEVTGHDPAMVDAAGTLILPVAAGSITIRAAADGYEPLTVVRDAAGTTTYVDVGLVPVAADVPQDEEPPVDDTPAQDEPESAPEPAIGDPAGVTPPASDEARNRARATDASDLTQTCACVLSASADAADAARAAALLLGFGVLLRRRRR